MTEDLWALPPGPERRRRMHEQGWNIAPEDFTPEEVAESEALFARSQDALAAEQQAPA